MIRRKLTVTILGSGTSTGVPVTGCSCRVCTSNIPENSRTRCSALISSEGKNILIDTSTDLRQQALRENISHIDAVLYTHAHADHLHGIDDLRPFNIILRAPIPLYGSKETLKVIRRNFRYIFDDELEPGFRPRLETRQIEGAFSLFGLPIEPIPLLHGRSESLGYRIGPFAYLTDCSEVPSFAEALLENLDVMVIDGLRFRPHDTHLNISQALEVIARLKPKRALLTHLSHDVDYHRDSPALPPGVELARDGQRLHLEIDMQGQPPEQSR